ncbi:MAG TPA: methionyl-tRNA formyltransferase [Candidatus Saccharimonadia bacterium]|nr:methionyl-tRNA formyltransferase [Candidatus Saccharimonadia bacterium]
MTIPAKHRAPIVFFGTDAFSVPSLVQLIAKGWNIAAVVTKPDSPTGRGQKISEPAVKRLATAAGITVLQPHRVGDIHAELAATKAVIGVVVAYGKLIPPSLLELFPRGLVNIHASLLPRYRGASPIEAAILNGDDETGVTLMQLEAGLDTGPTYDVSKIQLEGTETRPELYERLAELGADLLAIRLPAILEGQVVPIPQNEAEASLVGRLTKADGLIDWTKTAQRLEREVRGYLDWPGSRTHLAGAEVTITAAHTASDSGPAGQSHRTDDGELAVYAATGSLIIDRLKPAGKRDMPARDFLTGHPLT